MKTILALLAIALCCPLTEAQNVEGQIIASQFGAYLVPGIATGSLQFEPSTCQVSGGGKNFSAFTTGVPVKIIDSNPALNEIATPAAVFINSCAISMATSHIHSTPFYATSGTGGLQEAILNGITKGGGPNTIILNADWYTQVAPGNPASVIASVHGSTAIGLIDVTTSPYTYYTWNSGTSQYVAIGTGAGAIPATNNVLCGSGAAGSAIGCGALPSTTTATTQAPGDNSTKVATTAYVQANSGSISGQANGVVPLATAAGAIGAQSHIDDGVTTPSTVTVSEAFSAGSVSTAALSAATGGIAALSAGSVAISGIATAPTQSPGNNSTRIATTAYADASSASALPSASAYGLVPISNAAGRVYSAGQVPLSFGAPATQYVQQQLGNTFFPSFNVNFFGKVFDVDGFSSYSGVGSAVIAYNASVDAPLCQVVSSSGLNYIALSSPNHATTPGTARGVWWPVPNNLPATNADCAGFIANAYTLNQHVNSLVQFGAANYTSNQGFADYIDGNGFDDQFSVSFAGACDKCTYLTYAGTAGIPVFNRTTGGGNFTNKSISNMTVDGGGLASAIMELGSLNQSYFNNLSVGDVQPGADHVLEFGHFGGDAFQVFPTNINIGVFPDTGVANCANTTVNLSGSTIGSVTINNAGACYNGSYTGLTKVAFSGTKNGISNVPCDTVPTNWTVTFTGSGSGVGIASVVAGSPGVNCVGPVYAQIYQTPNVAYGLKFFASDSSVKDVTSYLGATSAFYNGASDNAFIHIHPSVTYNGIYDAVGGGQYSDTEIDAVGGCGFNIQSPFAGSTVSIKGTHGYIGSNSTSRLLYGQNVYCLATTTTYVNFGTSGPLCQACNPGPVTPPGWVEILTPNGPLVNPSDYLTKANKISVLGNDSSIGEVLGDYTPILTVGTLNATTFNPTTVSATNIIGLPLGTATSGANFGSSTTSGNQGSYWNGSAAAISTGSEKMTLASGTNPNIQRVFNIFPCPAVCQDVFSESIVVNGSIFGQGSFSVDASGNVATAGYLLSNTSLKLGNPKTTVSCSTSGTAIFSQPEQGASDKKVLIHLTACLGTASYTYPTAFTNTPSVYASNNVAASVASTVSTSAVTVTGATSTGSLVLEDY